MNIVHREMNTRHKDIIGATPTQAAPIIAIVGSVDPTRDDYDPPIRLPDVARQAAEEIGRALARAGYRIMVYSRDTRFIEADVVRGYVASGSAQRHGITIRYPTVVYRGSGLEFPEEKAPGELFYVDADTNDRWEVSFYRSLRDVQGVFLIGGAQAVLITGILAQAYRIPLVSVATFGGTAQTVWRLPVEVLAEKQDHSLMGSDVWKPGLAESLVKSFDRQRAKLADEERARMEAIRERAAEWKGRAAVGGLVLIVAVVAALVGTFGQVTNRIAFGALFLGTPMLAGAAGGLARVLYDYVRGATDVQPRPSLVSAVLGMGAGVIAALLFALAQWASNPPSAVPGTLTPLIPFEFVIGFIAGLTLEAVFSRLRETNVLTTTPVAQ